MVVLRDARTVAGPVAKVASALNPAAGPWIWARLSVHRLGGCVSVRSSDARLTGLSTTYRTWLGMIIKDRRCVVQETVQETLAILVTLCDL